MFCWSWGLWTVRNTQRTAISMTPHSPEPPHTCTTSCQTHVGFLILLQVALRHIVSVMSPHPQPPCLAVYAAEFEALDVAGTGRLPADLLVELLSSDKWDLTDVEVCSCWVWEGEDECNWKGSTCRSA